MQTGQKITPGKNELWTAYQNAPSLIHAEILLELKKAEMYRHWQTVASKDYYDLRMARAPLRDIFLKLMPETAPLFGIKLKPAEETAPIYSQ